jgi:hypothetical protein
MKYLSWGCSRCISAVTLNVAFLVIGIVMYSSDISNYGEAIWMETRDWERGAIIDLISVTNQTCPSGYEHVTGDFPGTLDYCRKLIGDDTVGKCTKKKKGTTVYGLDPIEFEVMNNQILCIKRDNAMTYHTLAATRGSMSCSQTWCGSDSDTESKFCVSN